jgi:phospholipid-binding lipoprotein MlaA
MTMRTALLAIVLLAVLSVAPARGADDGGADPWEGFNRAMFTVNDGLDRFVLEPVAKGYDFVVPLPLEQCISNFFKNLRVPLNSLNGLLQGKPVNAASDVGRFTVNTTLGLAGFLDPATYFGLVRHDEDFGQTLGVWGVPNGPYLVIPLLGPSTIRDTGGLAVDSVLTPGWYFLDAAVTIGSRVVDTVNSRALLLEDVERARSASFDFYGFVRNAYLSHRASLLRDDGGSARDTDNSLYFLDEPAKPAK